MADINKLVDKIVVDTESKYKVNGVILDLFSDDDVATIDASHTSKFEPSALVITRQKPDYRVDYADTWPEFLHDYNANALKPRSYQEIGIEWLETRKRTMLTDQPGLGKTLQAAMAAKDHKPVLVVAPTYLTKQWYDFLVAQFPKDRVNISLGLRDKKEEALFDPEVDWAVINTQMLRTHDIPVRFTRGTIIFDEFHHLRNQTSKQSKAAKTLANHNPQARVYGLTATPVWKEIDDLWHLFHIMQPTIFPSYRQFVKNFCVSDEDSYYGLKVSGVKKTMIAELEQLLDFMRLGRTYTDVGRMLPEIINKDIKVDMSDKTRTLYDQVRNGFLAMQEADEDFIMTSYMEVLHSLRRITAGPQKTSAVVDALEDAYLSMPVKKRKPVMIFTWYKESAYSLFKGICNDVRFKNPADPVKVCVITGDVPITDRREMAMNHDIVIASIPSLSEGVNMYHARTVMFFEEHWPPGANYQALSRVRRDRNDDGADVDPVIVYDFHCTDTVDDYIHKVAHTRGLTIQEVLIECLK